jgi:hypothetical protein
VKAFPRLHGRYPVGTFILTEFIVVEGGWNQEEKIVKKAKIVPTTYAFADHPGVGRVGWNACISCSSFAGCTSSFIFRD